MSRTAARAVTPVAIPSSTSTTVRPSTGRRRTAFPVRRHPAPALRPLGLDDAGQVGRQQARGREPDVVPHHQAGLGDGAEPQLRLPGHADLAHHQHVQRCRQGRRHRRGHLDPAAGQAQHQRPPCSPQVTSRSPSRAPAAARSAHRSVTGPGCSLRSRRCPAMPAARSIPDPGFAGDDGSADPGLVAAVAAHAADPAPAARGARGTAPGPGAGPGRGAAG